MAYTPFVWKDDPTGGTPITATRLNSIESGISAAAGIADAATSGLGAKLNSADAPELIRDTMAVALTQSSGLNVVVNDSADTILIDTVDVWAPAPSGKDDTTVLQALVNQVCATGGTLQLRAGTYQANLLIDGGLKQPLIVGRGRKYTFIQAVTSSSPAVRFHGQSGQGAGGGLRSLGLLPAAAKQGIGLQFSGCDFVQAKDVYVGSFATAVNFNNEGGNWTEFCTFDGETEQCVGAVKYSRSSGATQQSFHGSGVTGDSILGTSSDVNTPVIQIDDGCFPYNAPMSFTTFMSTDNQMLMRNSNQSGTYFPGFFGDIRIEAMGLTNTVLGSGANSIFYQGVIQFLSGAKIALGNIYLCRKLHYGSSNIVQTVLQPMQVNVKCNNSPVQAGSPPFSGGEIVMIAVTLRNSGYHQSYLLSVQTQYGGLDGQISVISRPRTFNYSSSYAYGDPSLTWNGGGLYISNSNFPSNSSSDPVVAYVTYTPMGGVITNETLPQNCT